FFFQAEDDIRDFHVTGVQTCALPILERRRCDLGPAALPGDVKLPDSSRVRKRLFCSATFSPYAVLEDFPHGRLARYPAISCGSKARRSKKRSAPRSRRPCVEPAPIGASIPPSSFELAPGRGAPEPASAAR